MFQNLPGHVPKCIETICAVTLGRLQCDLSSLSFLLFFLISPLSPEFSHRFSPCGTSAPSRAQWGYNEGFFCVFFFFCTAVGRFSFFFPALASLLLVGRQLWIIKWWIRGYFLPTQTCGGWAGILAVGFIPLSSQNATKSHCCPSSPSKKRVESPHIPVLVPRQDQRALDAAGKNSCGNRKQQSTSVDYLFFRAASNPAVFDNVIIMMVRIISQKKKSFSWVFWDW